MAICHSNIDLQDIQEGSSVRNFSLSPTLREACPREPSSRVEHDDAHLETHPSYDKSSGPDNNDRTTTCAPIGGHAHVVKFEPVTRIIVLPDAEKGRPRVQLRRMSLSLSFSKAPSEESLDDPYFTPISPRRIFVRVPSLTRSQARSTSTDRQSSCQPLRSCLVSGSDGSGSNCMKSDSQSTEYKKSRPSPKNSPVFSKGTIPSSPIGMPSGPSSYESATLSGFMSRPLPDRSNSTSSVANTSSASRQASNSDDPTEALQPCCLECYRGTELGFQGEWEDAPWSSGAMRKKRKDDEEREKKEAERRRIGERYGKLPPLSPGGCMDDIDWENSGISNRFGTGVVVDEVTLARKNSSDHVSGANSQFGLNHSTALLRLDRSSSLSPREDGPPFLSPENSQADSSTSFASPPWDHNTKSPRVDKPIAYDGMPSSEQNGSLFPDFHSSSIFGGTTVETSSPIETPELSPSSTPAVEPDSGDVPAQHSHPSSSSTESHIDEPSSSPPSSASQSSPLPQTSPSTGSSSLVSPISCPTPTTATSPTVTKRFLSGLSFGGINKVFKHSTKGAGAGHGFF